MNMISSTIEHNVSEENKKVRLLKKFDNFLTSPELFYDHLEEVLLNDADSDTAMYFLVIKYAGFVSKEAQQIGKNPIPGHPNVLKIIVATNSIESSITIDGLAAVIDSGICNIPNFDRIKGITNLEEGPISTQSQTQRRGRVGRKREGICVQITIKGHPPIELRPPAIETEDISSNILSLRKIRINLEDINNLPLPGVPKESMKSYLTELVKIGALDNEKKLTKVGSRLAAFSSLSPFVSSSIVKVADKYDDPTIASIVGALAFLILSTNNIFVEAVTESFRRNFNEDSDVLTLMSSLIEMMQCKGSIRKRLTECGFHASNGVKLVGSVEQIASIIYDDDKQSLWADINEFYKSNDMMEFIQRIMKQIGKVRPDWLACRRGEYVTVTNVLNNPQFIYKGDKSLTGKEAPDIKIKIRPGGKGFAAPGSCFIMQFSCSEKINYYGSILHKDLSREEVPHPTIVESSIIMNNIYTVPLIEGYIGDDRNNFKPFQKTHTNRGSTHGGFICYPEQYGDKTVISYVARDIDIDKNAQEIMIDAIKKVEQLIPFAPRTILVKNDVLKSIVAVTSFGLENFTTKVIKYTDTNLIPYHINKNTINYLIAHKNELNDVDGHLVIAMTGENFSYLTEEEDYLGNPITWSSATSVFGMKSDSYSHLIILSNKKIPKAKPLSWVDRKISVTYSDVDALIHVSNQVFRGVVEVNHEFDEIYCMSKNAKIKIDGQIPKFDNITQDSNVFRPIGCMFDRFAMNCIKGNLLANDVKLNGFSISGIINCNDLKNDIIAVKTFQKNHSGVNVLGLIQEISNIGGIVKDLSSQRKDLLDQLKNAKDEMKRLYDRYNNPGENKKVNLNLQSQNKALRENLQNQINILDGQIYPVLNPICQRYNVEERDISKLLNIKSPVKLLELLNNVFVKESHIEIKVKVDERDEAINAIKKYRKDLAIEVVPICTIVVSHRSNSKISKDNFIKAIDDICRRFGAVVKSKSDYKEAEKSNFIKGIIRIILYTGEFAIPFAGEVQRVIGIGDKVLFKIPSKIIPTCLLNRPDVIDTIDKWIAEQGLNLHKSGFRYAGSSQEIEKAMNLLADKDTQLKIPYKAFTIPGGLEISKVMAALNRRNSKLNIKSRWGINKSLRLIYVPDEIEDEMVQTFINSINLKENKKVEEREILYDYLFFCDDIAVLSALQIPMYNKDGSVKLENYCVTCAYDLFRTEVERLFDAEEDKPRMNLLCENTLPIKPIQLLADSHSSLSYPEVPLGQLLWCLVSEPVMNSVVKTWFSAIVFQAFHTSQYFDYCPDHPSILMRVSPRMKCSQHGCRMYLCQVCKKWHRPGECKGDVFDLPPGFRICPGCKRPIEKTEACNHISCKCGKHFCYYCGFGPCDSGSEVYSHLSKKHKDY